MNDERRLDEIAANLDDLSEQVEEVKAAVEDEGAEGPRKTLKRIEKQITRAADAIDDLADPE